MMSIHLLMSCWKMALGRCVRAQGEGKGGGRANGRAWLLAGVAIFGTLQTLTPTLSMSALEGKADIPDPRSDVR